MTETTTSPITSKLVEFLNCPCQYFAPMQDDDPLMAAFHAAQKRGKQEGFIPMLVAAEDDILLETLLMNSDPQSKGGTFSPQAVSAYRSAMKALPLPQNAEALFPNPWGEEDDLLAEEDLEGDEGEPINRFLGYWDYGTKKTIPLILAEIPVQQPWEVFAYLPFGGWNECPDTERLMATAKYWFTKHGAVPSVVTHDILEFTLPQAVGREKAPVLAQEQYAWCADIVDQGVGSITALAQGLADSTVWYFWWD